MSKNVRVAQDGVHLYLYMDGKRVQSFARRWSDIEPLLRGQTEDSRGQVPKCTL